MPVVRTGSYLLHYEINGDGEPLLLLHGLGSSALDWQAQVPVFSSAYQVITPDLVGFGRSDKLTQPHSIVEYANDMFKLLDDLGIDRCHVLGYSMGGAVAFQMGTAMPRRVRSLIILNSLPSFVLDTVAKRLEYYLRLLIVRLFGMKPLARLVTKRLLPQEKHRVVAGKMAGRYARNDRKSYVEALKALVGWSIVDRLGVLVMPVLMISADQDYTPVEEKRKYLEHMPNARLEVIGDSRHATPVDQAAALNKIVLDFLDEVSTERSR
ncbi:MAG: alpha/beta fold hydrolase [Proteobacteria bacterium]|nr:alpha/beta fold hydrolase [Pseudomonadota bacterium]